MPQRFDNFFHAVTGNEGERCKYPTRLDTYGCGCQHNCGYCYARSLLDFRGLWNPAQPSAASVRDIYKVVKNKLRPGQVVRLGGMTDCFQPMEAARKNTRRTIEMLNARRVHYLIVTKGALVADYTDVLHPDLAPEISLAEWSRYNGGYRHLPLARKRELLQAVTGFREVSVCEDVPTDWEFWRTHINANPDDCCNLKL